MVASVCFICDILQIYKLRKNILLDKVFLMFYFRVGLVKLIKSNKKIYYLKKRVLVQYLVWSSSSNKISLFQKLMLRLSSKFTE